jgi:hypothetical protein
VFRSILWIMGSSCCFTSEWCVAETVWPTKISESSLDPLVSLLLNGAVTIHYGQQMFLILLSQQLHN